MAIEFQIGEFVSRMAQISDSMQSAAQTGLFAWGSRVLAESQQIVPIEEGTLSRSGTVIEDGKQVAVGYGLGAAAAYAVPQHERLDYHHDGGRSAKYLETPFVASMDYGPQIVAEHIAKAS